MSPISSKGVWFLSSILAYSCTKFIGGPPHIHIVPVTIYSPNCHNLGYLILLLVLDRLVGCKFGCIENGECGCGCFLWYTKTLLSHIGEKNGEENLLEI